MLEAKLDPVHLFGFYDLIPEPASSNLTPKKECLFGSSSFRAFLRGPSKIVPLLPGDLKSTTTNRQHLCLRFSSSRTARSNSACKAAFSAASRSACTERTRSMENGEFDRPTFFIEPTQIDTQLLLKPISVLIFLFWKSLHSGRLISKKTIPSHWFPLNLRTSNKNHPDPAEKSRPLQEAPNLAWQPIPPPVAPRNKAHLKAY